LKNGEKIKTVEGSDVTVTLIGGKVLITGGSMKDIATVTAADNMASNGVAHIINQVLIPADLLAELTGETPALPNLVELAASVPDLSTLVAAVKAGGLVDTLEGPGPFTVFAPTNEAFSALPDGVLKKLLEPENKPLLVKVLTYHVVAGEAKSTDLSNGEKIKTVEGENVTVSIIGGHVLIHGAGMKNVARVTAADNMASNGVAHIIDEVLIPASLMTEIMGADYAIPNIVELAASVPELSTLVTAVKAAGLVDTLEGPGPFTVLAPTNDAFDKIPSEVLHKLLEPENKPVLVKVLTYHVISGAVKSTDLKNDEKVKTVEGDDLYVRINDGHVFFIAETRDYGEVLKADVMASNGVVHIISGVLLPRIEAHTSTL
jgi:uncharacterized surface protein with fasciclin (FAS1) repeats